MVKQIKNAESSIQKVKKNNRDIFFEISKNVFSTEKIKDQNKSIGVEKEKSNEISNEKKLVQEKFINGKFEEKLNGDDPKLLDSNNLANTYKKDRNINFNDETNFYIDIPYHSINPVNILIKNHSPNNSTCDDNSNLLAVHNHLNPNRGNIKELNINSIITNSLSGSNLKFKIELQKLNQTVKEIKKEKKKINKPNLAKTVENELFKTYNDLKESKLLGKKRNLEEKNVMSEIEIRENIVFRKLTFDPEIIVDLAEYTNRNKKYTNNQINFLNDQFFLYNKTSILDERIDNVLEGKEVKIISHSHNSNITNQDQIMNPFDKAIRNEFAQSLLFQRKFQEDYVPIQLQKENENAIVSKTHFIKKKQSALNIKRHCGVSYVIPTESKQLNITDKYK